MNKKCSKKVISVMVLAQVSLVALAVYILSHMLDINIFNITNLTYIGALALVLFAVGFFAFSFKSCICCNTKKSDNSPNEKCCSEHLPAK